AESEANALSEPEQSKKPQSSSNVTSCHAPYVPPVPCPVLQTSASQGRCQSEACQSRYSTIAVPPVRAARFGPKPTIRAVSHLCQSRVFIIQCCRSNSEAHL